MRGLCQLKCIFGFCYVDAEELSVEVIKDWDFKINIEAKACRESSGCRADGVFYIVKDNVTEEFMRLIWRWKLRRIGQYLSQMLMLI